MGGLLSAVILDSSPCVMYHAGQPLSEASVCLLQVLAGTVIHHRLPRLQTQAERTESLKINLLILEVFLHMFVQPPLLLSPVPFPARPCLSRTGPATF